MAADAARVQQLLLREATGKLSADEAEAVATLRRAGEFPDPMPQPGGAPPERITSETGVMGLVRQAAGALDPMGEMVVSRLSGERPRLEGAALAARTLPSLGVANPLAAGALSAIGETAAQGFEQEMGTREDFSPTGIGVAGALPLASAGVLRGGRALGRTATRTVPSLFQRAQSTAQEAVETTARQIGSRQPAGALFAEARGAAAERVPGTKIVKMLDELEFGVAKEPATEGLRAARTIIDRLREDVAAGGGSLSLQTLNQTRNELGELVARQGARTPEFKALYKSVLGALEDGAQQGGAGAATLKAALTEWKRDFGALRFKELAQQATRTGSVSGADTPMLSVAKLSKLVTDNRKELMGLVGDDGVRVIDAFVTRFRSLPPTHAATAANILVSAGLGGVGAVTGLGAGSPVLGAAIGLAAKEVLQNVWAVGANPAGLNRLMTGLAQATRGVVLMQQAGPVRVGPEAQAAARTGR